MSSLTFSPTIRASFGDREYYFTTMKARDAVREVKLPNELFDTRATALDERMQRDLEKSKRVAPMVEYLKQAYRFYSPLVVALKGGDPTFIPLEMADPNPYLDAGSFDFGVLRFDGTQDYFVLDGQHRLASIAAAIDHGNDEVKEDDVGVIIIRHQDSQEGVIRTRRLFTNLNRWAKATTMSENITIDEDDGIAILTRQLVRDHPLLAEKIWYKTKQLPPSGNDAGIDATLCFTTLETVYNCNDTIVKTFHNYPANWKKSRPEPEELDQLHEECKEFWDGLRAIDAIEQLASGQFLSYDFRPNTVADRGNGHLLFRPIGLETLARAYSAVIHDSSSPLSNANQVFQLCAKMDWTLSSPPWLGLFFGEGGTMLGSRARQVLGAQLIRYMLGVAWPDKDGLLQQYRQTVFPSNPESEEALELLLPPLVATT